MPRHALNRLVVLLVVGLSCTALHAEERFAPTAHVRSFYIGMTPWPYDFTPQAPEETYRFLGEHADFIAVSSYRYGASTGNGRTYADPATLPSDWFRRIAALAPEKPFAIAETGFQAEDFVFRGKLAIPGNITWQAHYVRWLLQEADALDARFVVWFVPRDYDRLWEHLEKMGLPELFKSWRDIGLQDEAGRDRPALQIWDAWRRVSRR